VIAQKRNACNVTLLIVLLGESIRSISNGP
jgi:hypothetical protein